MLAPKLITFFVGLALLLPFAITFWLMAFRTEDSEAELKMRHEQVMAELKAEHDSNLDAENVPGYRDPVMVGIVAYDFMCLPMVPPEMWSFFPRRWVGIFGLFCVFIMTGLWLLSSFIPSHIDSGSIGSTPSEPTTSPGEPTEITPWVEPASHRMKALLSILLASTLCACGPNQTRDEITGTQTERVTRATAILSKYCKLPGPLLDAHMAQDVISGGMVPGPSNETLSGVITFPAADLPKWQKILSPQTSRVNSPSYGGHLPPPTWWPAAAAFKDCEYYEPKKLTGRIFGFVALSPSTAALYFSTASN